MSAPGIERTVVGDFGAADDLLWNAVAGNLASYGRLRIARSGRIGPLVEMALARRLHREPYASIEFAPPFVRMVDDALTNGAISGAGQNDVGGVFPFVRHDPATEDWALWDQWAKHAENAAVSAGLPRRLAEGILGALGELQDNVYLHSARPETGIAAYAVAKGSFEFVVADQGIGVLASLRQNPEFASIADAGTALRLAASDGASRLGAASGHGYGIGQLFRALAQHHGELRFRSDDHALTLSGNAPSLGGQVEIAQKARLPGLVISVRCTARPGGN